ncbi:hypothetical protein PVAP13_4KG312805 [Panicum virgatum]|uniref:Uncharacterized protein n=1 Tax=Panicum virgatum TaxID=38727 RepID=A0A8T0TSW6_PANVG|nr:hypothetical protein PVAP13_4KG312805 [Panicum virgatum]
MSRRAVSPSARGPRRGCSGRGAAKVRPPRRKPACSNLDSLKSQHLLGIVWGLQQPNCQSPELSAEHPDGYICSSGYPIPHAHRLFLHLLEHRIYQPT